MGEEITVVDVVDTKLATGGQFEKEPSVSKWPPVGHLKRSYQLLI